MLMVEEKIKEEEAKKRDKGSGGAKIQPPHKNQLNC